jgi:hypothetical protein
VPLTLTETDTVKAYAVDSANNASVVQTVTYTKQSASPTTYFSDDFNRADSTTTLGGSWVASSGTWGIMSNQAYLPSGGGDRLAYVDCGQSDNITVQVSMPVVINGKSRLAWRVVDDGNCYVIQPTNSTTAAIYKKVAGTWNVVNSAVSASITNGSTIKVDLTGATHKVYVNEVLVATFTDSAYQTATKHGIACVSNVERFDNFLITSL